MQKLINVLALSSFVVSGAIVGGGYYIFANKEVIIDKVKSAIIAEVTGGIMPSLPGLGGGGGIPADLPIDLPIGGTEASADIAPAPAPLPFIPSFWLTYWVNSGYE